MNVSNLTKLPKKSLVRKLYENDNSAYMTLGLRLQKRITCNNSFIIYKLSQTSRLQCLWKDEKMLSVSAVKAVRSQCSMTG